MTDSQDRRTEEAPAPVDAPEGTAVASTRGSCCDDEGDELEQVDG
jgi:hypothetical protein